MRRLTVLGIAIVVLSVACEGPERGDIVDPSFGKVRTPCTVLSEPISQGSTVTKQDLVDYLYAGIEQLFETRNSQNAAKGHIDNIVREICEGHWDDALSHVNSFVQQVTGQPADKLAQEADLAADLVNWAILLATDPDSIAFAIPAGAFLGTGILAVVDPAIGGTVTTRDGRAGVNTDGFASTGAFLLALSRLPSGFTLPGFPLTEPGYEIVTNGVIPPGPGILVQQCAVDPGDGSFERLKLGHLLGSGGVELLERVADSELTIDCGAGLAARSGARSRAPSWVQSIGRLARNVVRRALTPQPLHASYFAEKGLGGLAKAFSPFVPVDPVSIDPKQATIEVGETIDLTAEVGMLVGATPSVSWESADATVATVTGPSGWVSNGTVTGVGVGTTTITVTYNVTYQDGSTVELWNTARITVVPAMRELTVELENLTPHLLRVTDGGSFLCDLEPGGTGGATTCMPRPVYEVGSTVTLTATAWSTGGAALPLTSGHHIKISGLCDKLWPDNNEPVAFCTFEMPGGTPTISFVLTN